MKQNEDITPKADAEIKQLNAGAQALDVSVDKRREIEAWLAVEIPACIAARDMKFASFTRWRKTLAGINPDPPWKQGVSNVSVPITMWITAGLEARISRSVLKATPMLDISPSAAGTEAAKNLATVGKNLARVIESLIRNRRAFDGERAIKIAASNQVRYGVGALKVIRTPASRLRVPGAAQSDILRPGSGTLRWRAVPVDALLYFDGYDTDVDAMPFIGHQLTKQWSDIVLWGNDGTYYSDTLDEIRVAYTDEDAKSVRPALLREHDVAELYLNYDIDDDGVLEAIVLDWHEKTKKILRIGANQFGGYRPIRLAQFDLAVETGDAAGQGVCEKLQSVQSEANMIHNVIVEAAKRGAAHLTVVRAGSGADDMLGDEMVVTPGIVVATEDADDDIKVHPLGDPTAARELGPLEQANLGYAMNLTGMSQTSFGDVSAGKRVSAAVGAPAMREGRTTTENAIGELAMMIAECVYLSIDVLRESFPETVLEALLAPDDIASLKAVVFNVDAKSTRELYIVKASAQDVAAAVEDKKAELFALNQFLMGFYEKMNVMLAPLLATSDPVVAQKILLRVYDRLENGIGKLLEVIESVKDPRDMLVTAEEISELIGVPLGNDVQPTLQRPAQEPSSGTPGI